MTGGGDAPGHNPWYEAVLEAMAPQARDGILGSQEEVDMSSQSSQEMSIDQDAVSILATMIDFPTSLPKPPESPKSPESPEPQLPQDTCPPQYQLPHDTCPPKPKPNKPIAPSATEETIIDIERQRLEVEKENLKVRKEEVRLLRELVTILKKKIDSES